MVLIAILLNTLLATLVNMVIKITLYLLTPAFLIQKVEIQAHLFVANPIVIKGVLWAIGSIWGGMDLLNFKITFTFDVWLVIFLICLMLQNDDHCQQDRQQDTRHDQEFLDWSVKHKRVWKCDIALGAESNALVSVTFWKIKPFFEFVEVYPLLLHRHSVEPKKLPLSQPIRRRVSVVLAEMLSTTFELDQPENPFLVEIAIRNWIE